MTRLLFEPGNDSELADRVLELLGDRELRESMGNLGHRRPVSKFGAEETALRVQNVYQKVLGLKNGVEAAKQDQSGIGS
jgi:glycosyltransferase involved in cell wall biosynthesis